MCTCSPDWEQRVASSRWVQCCALQCMCERANKGSGKQITGKADTCKQGVRGRSPTGKGLPCKAGMRTKGKNPLPRERLVTHPDRTLSYGGASVRVGRPSDTLRTAVPSCHVFQVRRPSRYPRLYIMKGSRYRRLTTNLGARLAIGKPTPVTSVSVGGAQLRPAGKNWCRVKRMEAEAGKERRILYLTYNQVIIFFLKNNDTAL
jgi:hypothetical protein